MSSALTTNRIKEIVMNAKLIATAVALALLGSANVFADQSFGRSSVYATPGSTTTSAPSTVAVTPRQGRSSVYVGDVPTAPSKSTVVESVVLKPGRA